MKNICILRLSALGDCCHVLSIVQTLQRHLPDSNISWVINKNEYQLFRDIPGVDFIVVDKENLAKSFLKIFFDKRKKVFDVLLNLHASASANFISLAIKAERKIGYDKARARDKQNWFCDEYIQPVSNQHVADAMIGFLPHLNIKEVRPSWSPLHLRSEEEKVKKYNIKPVAKIIAHCSFAHEPKWFTTAPSKAIEKVLNISGLSKKDIDIWEINEAFAAVAMAAIEDFNLDETKVNIHGGAIALGHPIGASGARILTTLLNVLKLSNKQFGLATLCIGGGEASAMIVERI